MWLQKSAVDKLVYLFRNTHVVVKNDRPLSDYDWLCLLDQAKCINIGTTYLKRKAALMFTTSMFVHPVMNCVLVFQISIGLLLSNICSMQTAHLIWSFSNTTSQGKPWSIFLPWWVKLTVFSFYNHSIV
jgi:hypothetical protein